MDLDCHGQWADFCAGAHDGAIERPHDIPSAPHLIYRDQGWAGWGDFLGSGNLPGGQPRTVLRYEEARRYVRRLKLRNANQWKAFCAGRPPDWLLGITLPEDIPASPQVKYAGWGWRGWRDWLGTDRRR